MRTKTLLIIFFLIPLNVIKADDLDINEGYLYPEEMQNDRIKKEKLQTFLHEDSYKIWSNCFSDNDESKDNEENENQYIGQENSSIKNMRIKVSH